MKKSLIFVTCILLFSTMCHAESGLGRTPQEFQAIKAKVTEQIKGTEATVSEVSIPKFNQADIDKIKKAQEELAQ